MHCMISEIEMPFFFNQQWEKQAQTGRKGLWAASKPQKPWEWRKDKRNGTAWTNPPVHGSVCVCPWTPDTLMYLQTFRTVCVGDSVAVQYGCVYTVIDDSLQLQGCESRTREIGVIPNFVWGFVVQLYQMHCTIIYTHVTCHHLHSCDLLWRRVAEIVTCVVSKATVDGGSSSM